MESLLELSGEGFVQFLHKTPNEGDVDFVKTGQTCFDTCVVKKATPPMGADPLNPSGTLATKGMNKWLKA